MSFKNYTEFVNESKSKGEYSYKEMRSFLEKIIKHFAPFEKRHSGPSVNIPHDRNASSQVFELEKDLIKKFDSFYKSYKSENPTFYVWNFGFRDYSLSKGVKMIDMQRTDIKSLFQVAATNPGTIDKLNISFSSKKQEDFGKAMSRGDYGPLD
tara:strand:+ start:2373 stop:2831 length:459 start_codon:yes stop_codon:yes gene_type:complete